MDQTTQRLMMGAAGASDDPVYVEDVYWGQTRKGSGTYDSTYGTQIDLAGEGGMVIVKARSYANYQVFDTERGNNKHIYTDTANQEGTTSNSLSFGSSGYTVGNTQSSNNFNNSSLYYNDYVFRKCKGFFDIQVYSSGSSNTSGSIGNPNFKVFHDLGCKPGMIWIKRTNGSSDWWVWHKGDGTGTYAYEGNLNGNGSLDQAGPLPRADVTDTYIKFAQGNGSFNDPHNYVAYFFADGDDTDAQVFGEDKDKPLLKMGTYTGNGVSPSISGGMGPSVNVGFEPQFLLIKKVTGSGNMWIFVDDANAGGGGYYTSIQALLGFNETSDLGTTNMAMYDSTGFTIQGNSSHFNTNGATYTYFAIRRPDPHVAKPVEDNVDLFTVDDGTAQGYFETNSKFNVDFAWTKRPASSEKWSMLGRKWQRKAWSTDYPDGEGNWATSNSNFVFNLRSYQFGGTSLASTSRIAYMWRRSECFNVFTYRGNGNSNRPVPHGLTTTPRMIWIRPYTRQGGSPEPMNESNTFVFHYYSGVSNGSRAYATTFGTGEFVDDGSQARKFGPTWPNTTNFYLGAHAEVNRGGGNQEYYVAMVWSDKTGFQKVNYYYGSGSSSKTVTTGFQPRMIMIKCASHGSTDWLVFDTKHGITNGGNERPVALNRKNPDSYWTSKDWIDISSTGFELKTSDDQVNGSGRRYVYLACA
jgi:hypothetical protein